MRDRFAETLAYTEFPPEHCHRTSTNNGIERINREIRKSTRVVGTFPDGNSALMLVTARLKYIAEHECGKRRYLDRSELDEVDELWKKRRARRERGPKTTKSTCERILTVPLLLRLTPLSVSQESHLTLTHQQDRLSKGLGNTPALTTQQEAHYSSQA